MSNENDNPGQSNFGAAGGFVFGSGGSPIKIIAETKTVCKTCEERTGGTRMGLLREDNISATLICQNCGTVQQAYRNDVEVIEETRKKFEV